MWGNRLTVQFLCFTSVSAPSRMIPKNLYMALRESRYLEGRNKNGPKRCHWLMETADPLDSHSCPKGWPYDRLQRRSPGSCSCLWGSKRNHSLQHWQSVVCSANSWSRFLHHSNNLKSSRHHVGTSRSHRSTSHKKNRSSHSHLRSNHLRMFVGKGLLVQQVRFL